MKPFDAEGVRTHIEECNGRVVVAEEHYEGGAGYEAVCGSSAPSIKKICQICVTKIPGSAKPTEQLEIQGLDGASIAKKIRS